MKRQCRRRVIVSVTLELETTATTHVDAQRDIVRVLGDIDFDAVVLNGKRREHVDMYLVSSVISNRAYCVIHYETAVNADTDRDARILAFDQFDLSIIDELCENNIILTYDTEWYVICE